MAIASMPSSSKSSSAGISFDEDTLLPLTASDPLGYVGSDTNMYRYCGNSPTNATDPTGLDALTPLQIERYMDQLLIVARHTHVPIIGGRSEADHCDRWVDAFIAAAPKSPDYKIEKVIYTYSIPGIDQIRDLGLYLIFGTPAGEVRLRHSVAKVTFTNGYVTYFDDGWWAIAHGDPFHGNFSKIPMPWWFRSQGPRGPLDWY